MTYEILDAMASRGNHAASLRKNELQCLENIMTKYLQKETQNLTSSTPQINSENSAISHDQPSDELEIGGNEDGSNWIQGPISDELLDTYGGFLLSPDELLSLVEGLNPDDFSFGE